MLILRYRQLKYEPGLIRFELTSREGCKRTCQPINNWKSLINISKTILVSIYIRKKILAEEKRKLATKILEFQKFIWIIRWCNLILKIVQRPPCVLRYNNRLTKQIFFILSNINLKHSSKLSDYPEGIKWVSVK